VPKNLKSKRPEDLRVIVNKLACAKDMVTSSCFSLCTSASPPCSLCNWIFSPSAARTLQLFVIHERFS
jgi:hypothetical protein